MTNSRIVLATTLLILVGVVAVVGLLAINEYKSAILFAGLFFLYLPFFLFALKTKNLIFRYFMAIFYVINLVSPIFFFLDKERYSYSGWSAVKNFDFTVIAYFSISLKIFLFLLGIAIFVPSLQKFFGQKSLAQWRNQSSFGSTKKVRTNAQSNIRSKRSRRVGGDLLFFVLIASFTALNNWMFTIGIAITGLTGGQEALPFKLAGILYFFTRYGIPIILFFVLRHSSRSWLVILVSVFYATFSAFSQVSRLTFAANFAPIVYYIFFDKRYFATLLLACAFIYFYSTIETARFFVYLIVDNVATKGFSGNVFELLGTTLLISQNSNWTSILVGIMNRIGGAQDIVLGNQFDTSATGGSLSNFLRIYLGWNPVPHIDFQYALYGFTPPSGFAVGYGGTCSQVLQVSGGNPFVILILSLLFSILILGGEGLRRSLERLTSNHVFSVLFAGLFLLFLVAVQNYIWLYVFIFASFIAKIILAQSNWRRLILLRQDDDSYNENSSR